MCPSRSSDSHHSTQIIWLIWLGQTESKRKYQEKFLWTANGCKYSRWFSISKWLNYHRDQRAVQLIWLQWSQKQWSCIIAWSWPLSAQFAIWSCLHSLFKSFSKALISNCMSCTFYCLPVWAKLADYLKSDQQRFANTSRTSSESELLIERGKYTKERTAK